MWIIFAMNEYKYNYANKRNRLKTSWGISFCLNKNKMFGVGEEEFGQILCRIPVLPSTF